MGNGNITGEIAQLYLAAGLSVLPADLKRKFPALKQWKEYQERLPYENEVGAWFANNHDALCIVTGRVSGNLELIDFDHGGELFGAWMSNVSNLAPGLTDRLLIETSQSGGWHVVYRCESEVGKNMKLAQGERNGNVITLIETRGNGGIFLCSPSTGYELMQGDFSNIPMLNQDERESLLQAARELNEAVKEEKKPDEITKDDGTFELRPGDDYNNRCDLKELLLKHGWTYIYSSKGNDYYRRPGKDSGSCSASLKDNVFYVFSSNAQPFEPEQGYSPFSTWTRGLAWAMLGFAEQLEYLQTRSDDELAPLGGRAEIEAIFRKAAQATCDFYIEYTPTCGVPYWDTGAPLLYKLGDYLDRPAEPYNAFEPVDSSAGAIACQGLIRLGHYLETIHSSDDASRYTQAGLTTLKTLLNEPYLSVDAAHQGLLLHSVYHRPNGWDYIPDGRKIPCGESSMWGDYHLREAALYVQRLAKGERYYTFFGGDES